MTINELVTTAFEAAKNKGWHDKERAPLEIHMLCVSEISEASEEVRSGHPPEWQWLQRPGGSGTIREQISPEHPLWRDDNKPEGEAVELADCVIRIADYFGKKGWDLEAVISRKLKFNSTRPYRHGGKQV